MRKSILLIGTILLCVLSMSYNNYLHAQELRTRTVVDGRDTPWEIIWGPDNWIWMTEIGGKVSRVNPETGEVVELATIAGVKRDGEGGLLGMALHPDFPTVPHVFLAYNYDDNGTTRERIVRYEYNGTVLVDPVTILSGIQGSSIHNGCRLLFAPDKTLLITTGDAANQNSPQDHTSLNGKILRINPDGTFPADNPWPGSALYSTGHRNPQGIVFGPQGRLYSSEHGPSTDDEVNIIEKGHNYGWPRVHGYCDLPSEQQFCEDSSVVEPITAWTPTIAVCGLDYYNHPAIPEWNNSLLLLTLKASRLIQLRLSDDGSQIVEQKEYFANQFGRLRDLCIAPNGRVYISTSNSGNNRIIEIRPLTVSLQLSTNKLDFGTLRQSQTSVEQTVVLTNTGIQELTVTEAVVSGSDAADFSITGLSLPLVLAPQQQHTITVQFHPEATGAKSAALVFMYPGAEPATAATVTLQGQKSNKDISIPVSIDLGTIPTGTMLDTLLTDLITNTGAEPIRLRQRVVGQPFAVTSPGDLPIWIAQGATENVRLRATPLPGVYQRQLTAIFDDGIQVSALLSLSVTSATSVYEEPPVAEVLRVSPVPATSDIEIRITTPYRGRAAWTILDFTGRVIIRKEVEIHSDQMSVFWDGRAGSGAVCPAGAYTAIIEMNGQRHTAAIVLVR